MKGWYLYRNYDKIFVNKYGCAEGVAIQTSNGLYNVLLKNGRKFIASFSEIIKKVSE